MVTIISYPPSLKDRVTPRVWSSQLADRSFYANTLFSNKTAYRSEDVDVLVPGNQMRAFSDARSRLKLVPSQHPDLRRKQHEETQSVTQTAQKWSKIKQIRSSVISNTLWLINMKIHQILIRCNIIVFLLFIPPEVIIKQLSFKVSILLFKHNAKKQQNEFFLQSWLRKIKWINPKHVLIF